MEQEIWHKALASSFADPDDLRRYANAIEEGASEQEALAVGDNGIGCWGDRTTGDTPMVALPPEVFRERWGAFARGKLVCVCRMSEQLDENRCPAHVVIAELRDTMPSIRKITNGAGIDLNYAASIKLGLTPPHMTRVLWAWAADLSEKFSEAINSGQTCTPNLSPAENR